MRLTHSLQITVFLMALVLCPLSWAKTLTIGVDLTGSNLLLLDARFADGAAQFVSREIHQLNDGDTVVVRTFGARSEGRNVLTQRFEISRRLKASKIAKAVETYLRSLPSKDVSQPETNLIGWLEITRGFDCKNSGRIVAITDALESSRYIDANALISGTAFLPQADVNLTGCSVFFYGLGAGMQPQMVKILGSQWQRWMDEASADFDYDAL